MAALIYTLTNSEQCMKVPPPLPSQPMLLVLLMTDILTGVRWNLSVVLTLDPATLPNMFTRPKSLFDGAFFFFRIYYIQDILSANRDNLIFSFLI
jgi:hypothetical protein